MMGSETVYLPVSWDFLPRRQVHHGDTFETGWRQSFRVWLLVPVKQVGKELDQCHECDVFEAPS